MKFLGSLLKLSLIAVVCAGALLFYFSTTEKDTTKISTTSFPEEPLIMHPKKGSLIVSTITASEIFTRDFDRIFPIANTFAEIRVGVVYQYQIPLKRDWEIRKRGHDYRVIANRVMLTVPVAVDFKTLQKRNGGAWSLFSGEEDLNLLERTLSEKLEKKGRSGTYVNLQREAAREAVSEFVKHWVIEEGGDPEPDKANVFVVFEDEPVSKLEALGF
jgi:hypothetical protein